ncbi:hypothetical protein [Polaribacter sp. M15]
MTKQINIKLIILESISMIFLVNGIQRLYVASQGQKYDALMSQNWEKFESLTSESVGQFFANRAFWTLGIILVGILIIGIINWKNKIGIINTMLLFLIVIGIAMNGFFLTGITHQYLNYFCGIFAESWGISFLIGGIIITLIGILILWKTINLNKNTIHNTVQN